MLNKKLLFYCLFFIFITQGVAQQTEFLRYQNILSNAEAPDSLKADANRRLADLYLGRNIDSANYYADKAYQIAGRIKNPVLLAGSIIQQATNAVWLYENEKALRLYFRADSIGVAEKNNQVLLDAYLGIAYLYETSEVWNKALEYSEKALLIAENINDKTQLSFANHEIGSIYSGLNDYPKAIKYINLALRDFKKYGNVERIGICHSDLGRIYIKQKDFNKAEIEFQQAMQMFQQNDEPLQIAFVLEQLGELRLQTKAYKDAGNLFNKALNIYKPVHLDGDIARLNINFGRLAINTGDYNLAKEYLNNAYDFFKNANDKKNLLQSILYLQQTDSALGNSDKAYSYFTEYININDKLNEEKEDLLARELAVEFYVHQQEKENAILRRLNTRAHERNVILFVGGIIFFTASVLLLLLFFEKRKINNKLIQTQRLNQKAYKELAQISETKNKLFSILAHDLRSPLVNSQHLLQLAKTNIIDSATFLEMAEELEVSFDYNTALLENLLNWSKIQMNGLHVSVQKLSAKHVARDVLMQFKAAATRKQVFLQDNIPANSIIMADENILRIALRNTISNALKFSKAGSVIEINYTVQNEEAQIIIKDYGTGMTEEQLSKVFSFSITSTHGTQNERGAGIGLSLACEMMQKMGGNITVESKLGEGTSVTLHVNTASI